MTDIDPPDIALCLQNFRTDHREPGKCAFVMMRFDATEPHKKILKAIQSWCQKQGIVGLRADDKRYSDDLWPNVRTYMHGCGFGIAVFERLTTEEFNPNVSLEVGYMLALGKPVCLLKDDTLKTLPSDLIGRLYEPFKVHKPNTIVPKLDKWIKDKAAVLGLSPIGAAGLIPRYLAVRGLRWSNVTNPDAQALFSIASPVNFNLLDGIGEIVYFGIFQHEDAKEVVFRVVQLLKNASRMITHFENVTSKIISPAEVQKIRMVLAIIKAEIIISSAIEKDKVEAKVREMASDLVTTVPWVFYTEQDIRDRVAKEYEVIGEI
jgi:hypothetical protein